MNKSTTSIFCVDDDRINGVLLDKILKDYECTILNSGNACIQLVEEKLPDLILLDIEMPELNGMETCKKIREMGFDNIPIVFLSGNVSLKERISGYQHGGDDFISKPFDVKELLVKVNAILNKKQLLDKAHQVAHETTSSMTSVMRTLGETGTVIHFLQATFDCKSYDALAQKIIQAHK